MTIFPSKPANRLVLNVLALAMVLALAFLGSRGIWDPDEGRYTNVAANMVSTGDWLNPRRNDEVGHWTKPPLTYWAIAGSIHAFGLNTWAARLPVAIAYVLCVLLVWRIARRLDEPSAPSAALIYATMILPWAASQLVTTDYFLTLFETLAMWGFVESRFDRHHGARWLMLMWASCALAFLTKGPPGLLPLLVMLAYNALTPGRHRIFGVAGITCFAMLALPWFVAVTLNTPGLFKYFVGDEVVNRITTNEFGRNGQWYGWLLIYGPTIVLGTLPWTPYVLRWARALPRQLRSWRQTRNSEGEQQLLLAVWILLPLVILCAARSRLPLYVLPLMVPLAIAAAKQRRAEGRAAFPAWTAIIVWSVLLLALKISSAYWPSHKNAAEWARQIDGRSETPVTEVVFIEDMARYGLRLHLDAEIEKVSLKPIAPGSEPRFNPTHDEDLQSELVDASQEPGVVFVCKEGTWPAVYDVLARHGMTPRALGAPYRGRIIFKVEPGASRE